MMISAAALIPLLVMSGESPFKVTASTPSDELVILWEVHSFTVQFEAAPEDARRFGWLDDEEGRQSEIPRPIIELDLPDCVQLLGVPPQELITPADFAAYYIDEPYGRPALKPTVEVKYRLIRTPRESDTIGINVTAYLGEGKMSTFQRQRLELPVQAGATAKQGDPQKTHWGRQNNYAIGDLLPNVTLPSTQGEIETAEFLGNNGLLLATYRAHW